MKSLRELVGIRPTLHTMTEIGKLRELKVLELYPVDFMAHVPSGLQTILCSGFFRAFPRLIDPSLSCLTVLSISMWGVRVQPEHLDKLAQLPSLCFLRLREWRPSVEQEKLIVHSSESAFPCLTELRISCGLMFLKFQRGAMRKLRRLSQPSIARPLLSLFLRASPFSLHKRYYLGVDSSASRYIIFNMY
jgi:hypothetical protein